MKKLLIATSNPGKIKMFEEMLQNINDIEILYLTDFPSIPTPEEDGLTVEDNVLIKAKYYFEHFNIPVLSDDAGFEIEELGGEPGVMTRRRGGALSDDVTDQVRLDFYLDKVKDIPGDVVNGAFPFCRCLYLGEDKYYFQRERQEFYLTKNPRKIFKSGRPTSAIRVFLDGRHEMDVDASDPIWIENMKKEGFLKLLKNIQ